MASDPLLAPGTQWSQKPTVSLPAACAPRTKGAATKAVDAAAVPTANRRRVIFDEAMFSSQRAKRSPGPSWDLGENARSLGRPGQRNSVSRYAENRGVAMMGSTGSGGDNAPADRRCQGLGRNRSAALPRQGAGRRRADRGRGAAS